MWLSRQEHSMPTEWLTQGPPQPNWEGKELSTAWPNLLPPNTEQVLLSAKSFIKHTHTFFFCPVGKQTVSELA